LTDPSVKTVMAFKGRRDSILLYSKYAFEHSWGLSLFIPGETLSPFSKGDFVFY